MAAGRVRWSCREHWESGGAVDGGLRDVASGNVTRSVGWSPCG